SFAPTASLVRRKTKHYTRWFQFKLAIQLSQFDPKQRKFGRDAVNVSCSADTAIDPEGILAGTALSTLLGVGSELAAPSNNGGTGSVTITVRQSTQDTVNQVGQEITKRNASIQPTLTIRPGFPLRVMVNKDLILRPYQPLFFQLR
ncbi:MAG: TrbI/VirB10 family protein, partial [Thiobacillus sp.]